MFTIGNSNVFVVDNSNMFCDAFTREYVLMRTDMVSATMIVWHRSSDVALCDL
jgi:hypothetical protein